ncbi:MAG: hypothetical protein JSW58_14385 [Candidatus Latescibacterota bacterium]|nr:MAG: hypothetical protein JSW58_14385 [Candidatus Latescibacterota bacterium]
MTPLLLIHTAATWMMVGLIWTVQVVHYPLFSRVGEDVFVAYHERHMKLILRLLFLPALAETVTAVLLLLYRPSGVSDIQVWTGLVLLVSIWCSTFVVQVPEHRNLTGGFKKDRFQILVRSNWFRTAVWTARGIVALWMIDTATG